MVPTYELPTAATPVIPHALEVPASTSTELAVIEPKPVVPLQNRPKVTPGDDLIAVSTIAEYDGSIAHALRERLDFSEVIDAGARLATRDAYGVLSPKEFARYEVIRTALTQQSDAYLLPIAGAVITGIAAFIGIPTALCLMSDTIGALVLSGIGSGVAIAGVRSLFAKAAQEESVIGQNAKHKLAAMRRDDT